MNKTDALGCSMLALVGALWGLHGPAIKFAVAAGFTFPQLVLGEYVVATLIFGVAVAWQRVPLPTDRGFWARLLPAAAIGCGVPLFLFWAYEVGSVSVGATLLFLYVPFTQLLNFAITRRAPPPRERVAAVLVVAGATLAADFFGHATAEDLRGAPFAIIAALCFAGFFVLTSRLGRTATPALRSFVCCGVSCVIMVTLSALAGWRLAPAPEVSNAAVWLLVLGVVGQVIPLFLLVNFGPRTGSASGSILTSTELPVAVVASVALLGEPFGGWQVTGTVLVLAGIVLPHVSARARLAPSAG
jgi:drug/metabolite transporter (DMT)-like permease